MRSKERLCIVSLFPLLFFALLYIYEKLPVKVVIAKDISLPYNVFLYIPKRESFERGDYIEFVEVFKERWLEKLGNPVFLIKRIACTEGDVLETRGLEFYCNGKKIAVAKEKTPKGRRLKVFSFNGKIPEGYYFVLGEHPYSLDSRYLGLIFRSQITARVVPLW